VTTRSTAAAAFRYDATNEIYNYNWSTKGLTAGTYKLGIDLADGRAGRCESRPDLSLEELVPKDNSVVCAQRVLLHLRL